MTRVFEIPLQSGMTHFSQQTELDGKSYTLEFEWVERDTFWMLHVGDENGQPLACGIKLLTGWPLLRRDIGVLRGQLVAIDSDSAPFFKLLYLEADNK
jgi:hypothetical protein